MWRMKQSLAKDTEEKRDGKQMSDDWLTGEWTEKNRILKAVDNDKVLAEKIKEALGDNKLERKLSVRFIDEEEQNKIIIYVKLIIMDSFKRCNHRMHSLLV